MQYAPALNVCTKCKTIRYHPANVPVFSGFGPQNWPVSNSGVPYINSGNNITNVIQIAGTNFYAGGDLWNPVSGFVPYTNLTTNGTVWSLGSGSIGGGKYGSVYSLPVTVTSDFTLQFDVNAVIKLSAETGMLLMDANNVMLVKAKISDFGNTIQAVSDLATQGTENTLATNSTIFPTPGYFTFKIKRVGTVVTMYINGVACSSYDFGVVFGIKAAIYYLGDSQYNVKNISVTNP